MIDLEWILNKFQEIIKATIIKKYDVEDQGYKIYVDIKFTNESVLIVKDLFFEDGERKNAFHWMDKRNNLITRWDNAPHHKKLKTFPHHKHLGKPETVTESFEVNLEIVLEEIMKIIAKR